MRITNNMLVNNMINNIGRNLVRMDKYQNQLATGKKIQVPSDDPVVAARALKLRTDVSEIDQYERNVKDGQSWMDVTEGTLGKIGDILQRAREIAVQGANGSSTTDDTKKIAEEAKQLRNQLIHLANTTYAGRYIFSGFKTDSKLVIDDENSPDYGKFNISVSSGERIKYEIGVGDSIDINVIGGDLFNHGGVATTLMGATTVGNSDITSLDMTVNNALTMTVDGETVNVNLTPMVYADNDALAAEIQTQVNAATTGTDIEVTVVNNRLQFTTNSQGSTSLITIDGTSSSAASLGLTLSTSTPGTDIETGKLIKTFNEFVDNLMNGSHANLQNQLADFDVDLNNLLRIRADIGARQNRLELTANRLESDTLTFTKLLSENEDVDMSETIMNLKNEENVYRASLSGGARIIQPSLVDFLR